MSWSQVRSLLLFCIASAPFMPTQLYYFILRFAELENLVFLSMLVMKYKVSIKPEPEFACESFEEKKKRIFKYYHGLTIT